MKNKFKYLLAAAAVLLCGSCAKEVYPEISDEENIMNLVVKGMFVNDLNTEFPSVVDMSARTIVVQVPYYLSDTEEIMGDLTKMKVKASLPVGAKFNPSLSGIRNMIDGFKSNLEYYDAKENFVKTVEYTFSAVYKKSDEASLLRMKFNDPMYTAPIAVKQPEVEGENGVITVMKSVLTEEGLKAVVPSVSPWATIECEDYDPETGLINMYDGKPITVVSQSGNVRNTYVVDFSEPKTIPYGIGYSYAMFGHQIYTDDTKGFTHGDNRTMAAVGSYLILSNASDFSKMPVYNRMTGEYLGNNLINTSGINADDEIHAISTDDAGHLVAATYVSTLDNLYTYVTKSTMVRIYVWKDGIDNAPVCIFENDMTGPVFAKAPVSVNAATNDLFRVISVAGDLLSGEAVLTTASKNNSRPVFLFFKDGRFVGKDGNGKADVTFHDQFGKGTNYSLWHSAKIKVMDPKAEEYFHQSGNFRHNICYSKNQIGLRFDPPKTHWWAESGYSNPLRGMDVVDFNGARLLAVQGACYAGGKYDTPTQTMKTYVRTYVADVTQNPSATSLNDGFLFDTREGAATGRPAIEGTGFAPTGMTSPASFVSGKTVFGDNWPETGDVIFVKSADGSSVQMYCLTTDQGLIGYNITNLDI